MFWLTFMNVWVPHLSWRYPFKRQLNQTQSNNEEPKDIIMNYHLFDLTASKQQQLSFTCDSHSNAFINTTEIKFINKLIFQDCIIHFLNKKFLYIHELVLNNSTFDSHNGHFVFIGKIISHGEVSPKTIFNKRLVLNTTDDGTSEESSGNDHTVVIACSVVGAVIVIGIICGIIYYCYRKRQKEVQLQKDLKKHKRRVHKAKNIISGERKSSSDTQDEDHYHHKSNDDVFNQDSMAQSMNNFFMPSETI